MSVDDVAWKNANSGSAVKVRDLTKAYGGELALAGVHLEVGAGEVLGLVGPNGAGKSTLISCLGGATRPDSGTITVGGATVTGLTPATARSHGIAVIYQHFSLAASLTVAENLFLGAELRRGPLVDNRRQRAAARKVVAEFGLDLDPDAVVETLSPGEQQLVEIAKALLHSPQVLILDEPTSALSVAETDLVLDRIRALSRAGLGIIFISHLLDDVLKVSDRIVVLRDGRVHASGATAEFTKSTLVKAITPTSVVATERATRRDDVVLSLRDLEIDGRIGPVDLEIHAGEIVGVFGLLGSGRTELLEAIYGVGPLTRGRMEVASRTYTPRAPREALACGVALVPSDRPVKGLFGWLRGSENVLLPHFTRVARAGLMRRSGVERDLFRQVGENLQLRPRRDLEGSAYSGGNQQKLLLGRWLNELSSVKVLLLDEPTQGVDVGARAEIYQALRSFVALDGCCVLFAASETEELVALADRVAVLHRGRLVAVVPRGPDMEGALLNLAHGIVNEETCL